MIVLTPLLASRMLDVWYTRQSMLARDRARCVGTIRDAALRAQTPRPNMRNTIGFGRRTTRPWSAR